MSTRHTLLLELAYDGGAFFGVARQPGYPTVSETLERHLSTIVGAPPRGLTFAARTDRGVSAEQNFATCWYRDIEASESVLERLRANLGSLQVKDACWVARSVNARAGTTRKHYRYCIAPGQPRAALAAPEQRVWAIVPNLDVESMRQGATFLVGTHDYSTFRAAGCDGKDPVKTLESIDVQRRGDAVVVDVVGRAFLRKMVRILVGTLTEVGAGLRAPESLEGVLAGRDRSQAGLTAPARGLCLMSIQLPAGSTSGRP